MTAPTRPPHCFTLTANLLAERTLEFTSWTPGRTQRATGESFQVGGKGINVSRMLTRLGTPNTALGFAGGAPGDECAAWLRVRGLDHRLFRTGASTRVGTVVRTTPPAAGGPPDSETTFLGPDASPDPAAIAACAGFLDAQPPGQLLAVCGSIPGWSGAEFEPLRGALRRWLERGLLVADTYGPPLAWLAGLPLALIKINAHELRTLIPDASSQPPPPTSRWVITDGPGTLRAWEGAQQSEFSPPRIAEVSPTGSGDVFFACVLHALYVRGANLREAVAFALPYAAANAAHPGIAEFPELQ